MAISTTSPSVSTTHDSSNGNGKAGLKPMRKGTKSCLECRRRKIRCIYPDEATGNATSALILKVDASHATEDRTTCIECQTHDRRCETQGLVAPAAESSCSLSSPATKAPSADRLPGRIYKRRRDAAEEDEASCPSPHSGGDQDLPRVKILVNRIDSVVQRLTRERENAPSPGPKAARTRKANTTDSPSCSTGTSNRPVLVHHDSYSQRLNAETNGAGDKFSPALASDYDVNRASPLLTQLFNNEMVTQTSLSPAVLTQKVQTLTFSNLNADSESMSDVEKLRSTISPEPYLLEVLSTSTTWWIAWRDQSFALHEVFFNGSSPRSATASTFSDITDASDDTENTGAPWPHQEIAPTSLHDFVSGKLSEDNAISVATGLLCIAMSLQNLKPGVDDIDLNISASPADIAERILLAVDIVLLSPSSDPTYMRDPALLLLYMMRAKMYAESNQLRKSWLSIRKAIEVARECGFTDSHPSSAQESGGIPTMSEVEVTRLLHRQRWIGSILELDRLMSMVLGFPHAQDDQFSDRLALAVLKGEVPTSASDRDELPVDLKMRALRRVVAVIAGRVNDRNASSESDDAKQSMTMSIQSSLDEAGAAMPIEWWDIATHMERPDRYVTYQHLIAQMWFWQVQSFLHLPYMMKPGPHSQEEHYDGAEDAALLCQNDQYLQNRTLCLQGCRSMLRLFHLLRSDPSLAVYICPCEDFQGIFNACILMVGLLTRLAYCPAMEPPSQATKALLREDLDLIEDIKDILRYRAAQHAGAMSRQGLKVLEELGHFLDIDGGDNAPRRRTVVLPYFGAIHLEMKPGRYLRERTQELGFDEAEPGAPPIDSVPTVPVTGAVGLGFWDSTQNMSITEWEGCTDPSFQCSLPDANLDWDQFLFGDELSLNWNLDVAEWPWQNDTFDPR
ncbi:hypothetical protein EDD37DRAFT_128609 [Exophiala viscosa]|uniref:Zn(2)-C6 fungal-type domain-containing protein n=1 Tax=Exophiala viscosa TaxID=2486360 RepID=A0AAN6DX36_9EURO|nr:hypothetical protein EDD36DRAFT_220567 [Exophiala viscosa]KAI1621667.1 hypothetical protein EDD37DRAFT_128609 [Exophiala viscosa]